MCFTSHFHNIEIFPCRHVHHLVFHCCAAPLPRLWTITGPGISDASGGKLGATACRILVPDYSEVYPVEDLIWDLQLKNAGATFRLASDALVTGDPLSAHFHDYDWADEVLHAQIGRRWMKAEGLSASDAIQRGAEIHERTWAALDQHAVHRDADPWQWWRDLVRDVLGRESEAAPAHGPPPIVGQSG